MLLWHQPWRQQSKVLPTNQKTVSGLLWTNESSGRPPAPVHEELDEDDEDADQHAQPQHDEAPAEQGEAVGLPVLLLALPSLAVLRSRPVPVSVVYLLIRHYNNFHLPLKLF